MKRILLSLMPVALVLVLWAQPAPSQEFRVYEPFHPNMEYVRAMALLSKGQHDQAVAAWLELARSNPGTTLGAESLFEAAYNSATFPEMKTLYQRIVSEYPRSRFEIHARLAIINIEHGYGDPTGRNQARDALLRSFGAPTLADIQKSPNSTKLLSRWANLHPEVKEGLIPVYYEMTGALALRQERYDDALPVALFNRQIADAESNGPATGMLKWVLGRGQGFPQEPGGQRLDPEVRILSPKDGQRKGPRPKFKAEANAGDFRNTQINIGGIEFTVDGQNRRPELVVSSRIKTKLKKGKVFERLRMVWRPAQPLTVGQHTMTLVVPTGGYSGSGPGITRRTLTFYVSKQTDDDEDSQDDDDDRGWSKYDDD